MSVKFNLRYFLLKIPDSHAFSKWLRCMEMDILGQLFKELKYEVLPAGMFVVQQNENPDR